MPIDLNPIDVIRRTVEVFAGKTALNWRVKVKNESGEEIPVTSSPSAQSPVITNLLASSANTEVSHSIPDGTQKILIRCRGLAKSQIAFVSTESGTKFVTIPRGATYIQDGLNASSLTLYIQTDKASQTIEILTWG